MPPLRGSLLQRRRYSATLILTAGDQARQKTPAAGQVSRWLVQNETPTGRLLA